MCGVKWSSSLPGSAEKELLQEPDLLCSPKGAVSKSGVFSTESQPPPAKPTHPNKELSAQPRGVSVYQMARSRVKGTALLGLSCSERAHILLRVGHS